MVAVVAIRVNREVSGDFIAINEQTIMASNPDELGDSRGNLHFPYKTPIPNFRISPQAELTVNLLLLEGFHSVMSSVVESFLA